MWQKRTQKILKFVVLMIGVIVGLQHLKMGGRAWFVARNDEPAALWLFIWTGPLCTFPASITAFFNQRIGGWWLAHLCLMSVGWERWVLRETLRMQCGSSCGGAVLC